MIKLRQLRCSFCRKNESQVSKLVAGPRVYICDECVAIAGRMMEDDTHDDSQPPRAASSVWRKLLARARQLLHGGGARRVGSHGVLG
ncbi:MAG: ATP-dependent Clp protease ATP-binding subunit ClpX [Acidobacteriota bacterium]|jgi:ATP-dependent protease Clp ATPase subunit|nr:ATP-dependent Clp protease ATP-binding subunit ClpX [Acidobacteriota bacterium]